MADQRKSAPSSPKAGRRPPAKKKPGRSIVNQRQAPWAMIVTAVVVVLFAGGIIGYAVTRGGSHNNNAASGPSATVDPSDPYRQPELPAAKAIPGVTYRVEPNHNHVTSGTVKYDTSPPTGGDHSGFWADCTGTVYPKAIANENAVHMLEHGAVWITYRPGLDQSDLATLTKLVSGQDRMALSPYPDLKAPISLQSWGYQLTVDKATDPRVEEFIQALRYNPKTTPEYGASCSNPQFKSHPSTWGHPIY